MRPSGRLHLGNLLGALNSWLELQGNHECLFMIADYHALTTDYQDTGKLKENIFQMLLDWLSVGIDPKKCILFRQSAVPEHAELHLLLSSITPLSWLERNPTHKEQLKELGEKRLSTYGFLGYPVLQTADILLYKATIIPVGVDQLPHLELAREITRRFNHLYGETFPLPKPRLTDVPKLPGIDGRKMSKSYNNCIYISDGKDEIQKKVRNMLTDPARARRTDKGSPERCSVFAFQKVYNEEELPFLRRGCEEATIGCTDCKSSLASALVRAMEKIWMRRERFEAEADTVFDILSDGGRRAREIASKTLMEVKDAMKIF
jgi:tryptophanyl-tRNA synthetase